LGGGGNDAVKNTNTNEIQILFAGYHKPAKLGNFFPAIFETFKVLSFYIVYSVQWGNFHLLFYLTVSIVVSVRYIRCVHFF
jgi:hypothetical protein